MDKELIAMCACEEIQQGQTPLNPRLLTGRDNLYFDSHGCFWTAAKKVVARRWLFLPSVSWLLREIRGGLASWQEFQFHMSRDGSSGEHFALVVDTRRVCGDARSLIFTSRNQRNIRIALLHVLMWQKGKPVWKDNEWRAK